MHIEPVITPFAVLLAVGAAQGFFFVLVLVSLYAHRNKANSYLACLVLVFSLELLDEFALQTRYYVYAPKLAALSWAMDFLYGPLIYVYSRTLTSCDNRPVKHRLMHWLPAVAFFPVILVLWQSHNTEQFNGYLFNLSHQVYLEGTDIVQTFLSLISVLTYMILSLQLLHRHGRNIQAQFSYREKFSLHWLRNLLLCLLALYAGYIVMLFTPDIVWQGVNLSNQILYLAMVLIIFTWEYFGLHQPEIFSSARLPTVQPKDPVPPAHSSGTNPAVKTKYHHSPLSADQLTATQAEIRRLMEREQLYLNAELTLPHLAKQIGLLTHYVSQAINSGGANFFDFVNRYRIEEAKKQLQESAGTSVLQIAMACGFNSKSAFYAAFKKHTDLTPTQYRKSTGNRKQ